MSTDIKIERCGFYVQGTGGPEVYFEREQINDELKHLFQEHEHLHAVMYVEVTPGFFVEERRRIVEYHKSEGRTSEPVLSEYIRQWTAKCGWVCPGYIFEFKEVERTASGNVRVYIHGGPASKMSEAKPATS